MIRSVLRNPGGKAPLVALLVALVVSSVFLPAGISAQDLKQGEIKQRTVKEKAPDPSRVFRGIESAWKNGDASALIRFVGSGRVYLDLQGASKKGGYFSKSQIYFLFKRHFSATRQLKFAFMRLSKPKVRGNKAFGIARRVYRDARNGRVVNDKVYVTLRREGRSWVLSEVKSMR